jgi:hypothetical protein
MYERWVTMNDKLPKVYAVPIEKEIKNNKEIFRSDERKEYGTKIDKNDIQKIFNDRTHVYKTRVLIKTINTEKEVDIVGLQNNNLLTLNGEVININDIIEIKKV